MGAVFSVDAYFIALRESMEIFLVIGVLLSFLEKSGNKERKKDVWIGAITGITLSVLLGFVFAVIKYKTTVAIFHEGPGEAAFEGITLAIACILITYMIIWGLRSGKKSYGRVQSSATAALGQNSRWPLLLLAFLEVFKEGIELALLVIGASAGQSPAKLPLPSLLGLASSGLIAFILLRGFLQVSLKVYFAVCNTILLLFAAGLCSRAFREFSEVGWFGESKDPALRPWWNTPLWDISAAAPADSNEFFSLMSSLFGYSDSPSFIEFISYWGYHCFTLSLYIFFNRRRIFLQSSFESSCSRVFFMSSVAVIASIIGLCYSLVQFRPSFSWNGALCSALWVVVALGGVICSLRPSRGFALVLSVLSVLSFLICVCFNIADISTGLNPHRLGLQRFFYWMLIFQWDWSTTTVPAATLTPILLLSIALLLNIIFCGGFVLSLVKLYFSLDPKRHDPTDQSQSDGPKLSQEGSLCPCCGGLRDVTLDLRLSNDHHQAV